MSVKWQQVMTALVKMLCPPGEGVYAITTMSDRKNKLHNLLYQAIGSNALNQWQQTLLVEPTDTVLLGVPSDAGAGVLKGSNWGPLILREQLYQQGIRIQDLGDVRVIPQLLLDDYLKVEVIANCRQALYQQQDIQLPVSPLSITSLVVASLYQYRQQQKIIALGGDHSISYPLVKEYLLSRNNLAKVGVIHFDAHTDLLEQRLGLPVTFGSWVFHILPYLFSASNMIQIGIRASQHPQEYWSTHYGVTQFWAKQINQGIIGVEQIIQHLHQLQLEEIYISFDIDAIDSKYVQATGTPEHSGLSPDFCYHLVAELGNNFKLTGFDLVEVAPFIQHDSDDQTLSIATKLLQQIIELIELD